MDLRLLETFVTVARTGSVSAASRDLYLSQSAVSRQVQRFERQMGVELFARRGGRAVELTEAGQRVLALGDELLGRTERLEEELQALAVGGRQRMVLGVSSSMLALPEVQGLLRAYHERHQDTDVTLVESHHYRDVLDALRAGEIDLCLTPVPVEEIRPPLQLLTLGPLEPRIYLSVRHPLAGRQAVTLADVADGGFAFLEGAGALELFDAVCAQEGVSPRVSHRCHQVVTLMALVSTGMAMTILFGQPEPPVPAPWDRDLTSVRLDIPCPPMAAAMVWRSDDPPRPAAQAFLDELRGPAG
jgi:DNA-binding transcriptional LysR family regulator